MSGDGAAGPPSTLAEQRAGIVWALADLDGLRARGLIDAAVYNALRHDYTARLAMLDRQRDLASTGGAQAATPILTPEHIEASPGPSAPADEGEDTMPAVSAGTTGDAVAPSHPTGLLHAPPPALVAGLPPTPAPAAATPALGSATTPTPVAGRQGNAELWINLLLYLGAFFVVMAALIFVSYSWRVLGGVAKSAIMLGFTAAFLAVGATCLRVPRVRVAGQTFLAIGALLTPLDIVALYSFVFRERGLSAPAVWAWGSLYCALFYGVLALRRLGRAYAIAATLALVSAWSGAIVALDLPRGWQAPVFLALPLVLLGAGRLSERAGLGRETFGPIPAVTAQLLAGGGLWGSLWLFPLHDNRASLVAGLALGLLFYALAAVTQPARTFRVLQIAAALGVGSLLAFALGFWARIPDRGYPAIALGLAWLALGLALIPRWRAAGWTALSLAASWLHAAPLLAPWGFVVTDRHAAYWTALFSGLLLFTLVSLWGARQPLLLYPVALATLLTIFHALRLALGAVERYPLAWSFVLLALLPVVALPLARRRAVARSWDTHLIAVSQAVALVAATLATDSRPHLTALLWLVVMASVVTVAIERRPKLLLLPNLWTLLAVPTTVTLSGLNERWTPAFAASIGVALALGLQGWRAVPPQRRSGWFMAHRWMAGGWAALGPVLGAGFLAEPFDRFARDTELLHLVLHQAYGPVSLAVALCALALIADAIVTLRRPTGYSASACAAVAILMGIARVTPNNPQAYAVPLGLYLLGLSIYVAYESDLGPVRMPAANSLLAAGVIVILGTTLAQSLVHPWRYIILGLVEGLLLLGATVFLRRRYGVALALGFLVLTTLRAAFDAARSLPNWAIIGLLGLALLGSAIFVLLRRDRFDEWTATAATRWSRLM